MPDKTIDLKKEQASTLARTRYPYSLMARFFFLSMDMVTGKQTTLAKAKLIETLASIPYRAWEIRQYQKMTARYKRDGLVSQARELMSWARHAQDNEYWHLLVIEEKMKQDGLSDPWYLFRPIPALMVTFYILFTRFMARFNIRRAFLFNAEFEDHAEHVYAQFVQDHPELETQPVSGERAQEAGDFKTWADVFRRIGLDERDHMNNSFALCGKPDHIVKYDGMPDLPGPA